MAHAVQWAGLFLGPVLGLLVYSWVGGPGDPSGPALSESGARVIGLAVLMATWWMTEALPVSITALVPVAMLPMLGVGTVKEAAAPYADDVLFLFMGGFILGEALRRSNLHRRIALHVLMIVGTSPARMIGGMMLATTLISMWVSNTATTIMMLPIGLSIVALVDARLGDPGAAEKGWTEASVRNFGIAVVLGIAYAASIAGIGTPIGSPPNLVMLNYARTHLHRDVTFIQWMMIGVPVVLVLLPAAWLLLTRVMHPVRAGEVPGGRALIRSEMERLGPMSRDEWITLAVFLTTAAAWILRARIAVAIGRPLTDSGIAIMAALALFIIPARLNPRRAVVRFEDVERLPWGVLLLFGGGLSIATAISRTGVDLYLGAQFSGLSHLPLPLMILILVAAVTLIGELASNTAAVTALMPVLAAAGPGMGIDPLPLMLAVTMASSCGYMLPVATPPNALAFATRRVTQPQMIRAGALLDIVGILLVAAAVTVGGPWLSRNTPASPPAEQAVPAR